MKNNLIVLFFTVLFSSISSASDLGQGFICPDSSGDFLSSITVKAQVFDGNSTNRYRVTVIQSDYTLSYTATFFDNVYSSTDGELILSINRKSTGLYLITFTDYGNTTVFRDCDTVIALPGGITMPEKY